MPDNKDMELDARPERSEYDDNVIIEINKDGSCQECKGYGVQFYSYNVFDIDGTIKQEVEEEPCDKCGGRL